MNYRALNQNLLRLCVVPVILALAILTSVFYFLVDQVKQHYNDEFDSIAHIMFTNEDGSSPTLSESEFYRTARNLIRSHEFESIALVDTSYTLRQNHGRPISRDRLGAALNNGKALPTAKPADQSSVENIDNERFRHSKDFLVFPIQLSFAGVNENAPLAQASEAAWVVVKKNRYPNMLTLYQAIISIFVIGFISLIITYHYSRTFKHNITEPLNVITQGLDDFINGMYDKRIALSKSGIFNPIIEKINKIALHQKSAQEELYASIEQSTQEIRETLETVEIQNIELDIARKNALNSSRVKTEFLANTSHEIRTPLNGIIGFSELLTKTNLTTQQAEYLGTIEESAKGLLTIINDVFDFSRLEIGELTLEYKPTSIRAIMEEAVKLKAPSAHEKKIRLLSIIDHDIPDQLMGDPLRLKQVIANLLSNAIKFTESGHILISASCEEKHDQRFTVKFRVTDSGIGLSEDQKEHLFDAFTQIDSGDNRLYGGTGLGLAIARGLVDRMKGEIGVESEPGKGATFWFTSTLGMHPNLSSARYQHAGTLPKVHALVYDTSTMGRMEVVHYAKGWGCKVTEISKFDEIENTVMENFEQGKFMVAILDALIESNENDTHTFNKKRFASLIEKLDRDFGIPCIIYAPPALQKLITPLLKNTHSVCVHRPVFCNRLHALICDTLGIVVSANSAAVSSSRLQIQGQNKLQVLTVDDNDANLRLVSELLKDLDIDVKMASSGKKALEYCDAQKFDLILMDIQMPEMDGFETTRRLREKEGGNARTPVVALTAQAIHEQKSKLLLAGMDDFLSKPVSETELKHVLSRWAASKLASNLKLVHQDSAHQLDDTADTSKLQQENSAPPPLKTKINSEIKVNERQKGPVDLTMALELTRGKTDLASDLLIMLIESLPPTKSAILQHWKSEDQKSLQEVIHKLHGSCCYCGVPKLKAICEALDKAFLKRSLGEEELNKGIEELIEKIDELFDWSQGMDIEVLFANE